MKHTAAASAVRLRRELEDGHAVEVDEARGRLAHLLNEDEQID